MQSVVIGFTNLVMTIVAMALIDRVGRKALLLVGSVTFVFSHALAAWVFATHAQGWIVIVAMMGIVGVARLFAGRGGLGHHQRAAAQRRARLRLGRRLLPDLGAVPRGELVLPGCGRRKRGQPPMRSASSR